MKEDLEQGVDRLPEVNTTAQKAEDARRHLLLGVNTLNQIRAEYGLELLQDEFADKYLTTKE